MQPFFVKLHLSILERLMYNTDEELVSGCSLGDQRAQRALYEQFARKMFGICLRYTATKEEAEDIMQEGFIKIFQAIGNFKAFGPLEHWVKKIIVNTALDYYRNNERLEDNELSENISDPTEPLQHYHAQELLAIIQKMPVGYRTIFNLHAIEGYNHKEISEMLNITEGTSKSQYSRARVHLMKVVGGNEEKKTNVESRVELIMNN